MGVHAIWVSCRCGCGCGHCCSKRYGPYFIDSTRTGSTYLGDVDAAAEKLAAQRAGGNPELVKAFKADLIKQALGSAMSVRGKGFEITPPSERAPHLAKIHGKEVRRKRQTKISAGTQEFWEQFIKLRETYTKDA